MGFKRLKLGLETEKEERGGGRMGIIGFRQGVYNRLRAAMVDEWWSKIGVGGHSLFLRRG